MTKEMEWKSEMQVTIKDMKRSADINEGLMSSTTFGLGGEKHRYSTR